MSRTDPACLIFCEADCGRLFGTFKAMNSHLASARSCKWYLKGKIQDIGISSATGIAEEAQEPGDLRSSLEPLLDLGNGNDYYAPGNDDDFGDDYDPSLNSFDDLDFSGWNELGDDFHFIPYQPFSEIAQEEEDRTDGPGPSTAAYRLQQGAASVLPQRQPHAQHRVLDDDDDDKRHIQQHLQAGKVLRKVPPPSYAASVQDENEDFDMDAPDNSRKFYPFISELDWRIAQWAVKDGIGHNSLDRLLEIPGVSVFLFSFSLLNHLQVVEGLGLSFHNVHSLHKKLDSLPEKAGIWQTKHLSFRDRPDDVCTIRFRDPVEAIKSLWKDPELSPKMKFAPEKIYSDSTKGNRIYSEMWTAKRWHVLQVRLSLF
jgi:hypothetical protein